MANSGRADYFQQTIELNPTLAKLSRLFSWPAKNSLANSKIAYEILIRLKEAERLELGWQLFTGIHAQEFKNYLVTRNVRSFTVTATVTCLPELLTAWTDLEQLTLLEYNFSSSFNNATGVPHDPLDDFLTQPKPLYTLKSFTFHGYIKHFQQIDWILGQTKALIRLKLDLLLPPMRSNVQEFIDTFRNDLEEFIRSVGSVRLEHLTLVGEIPRWLDVVDFVVGDLVHLKHLVTSRGHRAPVHPRPLLKNLLQHSETLETLELWGQNLFEEVDLYGHLSNNEFPNLKRVALVNVRPSNDLVKAIRRVCVSRSIEFSLRRIWYL